MRSEDLPLHDRVAAQGGLLTYGRSRERLGIRAGRWLLVLLALWALAGAVGTGVVPLPDQPFSGLERALAGLLLAGGALAGWRGAHHVLHLGQSGPALQAGTDHLLLDLPPLSERINWRSLGYVHWDAISREVTLLVRWSTPEGGRRRLLRIDLRELDGDARPLKQHMERMAMVHGFVFREPDDLQ
ncbi:MAG: hypothetical protein LPL00_06505 [Alphaproteobacteria bacterium]|nr:hypothetical protein [Alphaproteobacteria bacterium]MDX5369198.1 hypothetical protein [Alphaproteobacteria bacterium]MDX5463894.1 hypothetical protein [Alphaproteobacteria bacterium]